MQEIVFDIISSDQQIVGIVLSWLSCLWLSAYLCLRKTYLLTFLLTYLSLLTYLLTYLLCRVTGGELFEDIVAREFYSEADARPVF